MPRTAKLDSSLLTAVRRELTCLRGVNLNELPSDRNAAGAIRLAVNDAKAGIVVADFGLLLRRALTGAELKACQRAVARLEAAGKLRRLRLGFDGARMTHLQLVENPELNT